MAEIWLTSYLIVRSVEQWYLGSIRIGQFGVHCRRDRAAIYALPPQVVH